MNESIIFVNNNQLVTTSLAIAQNTNNDHASVIKLVRTYQTDFEEFGRVGFEIQPFDTAGGVQEREVAELNEQQSTLILTYMRNSEVVRAFKKRLVKEFWDMRNQVSKPAFQLPDFTNPSIAARAWADQVDKVQALAIESQNLQATIEAQATKVVALDRIANADGMLNLQTAGKTLQQQPNKFIQWMRENDWIYKRAGSAQNCARAEKFNAGYLTTKTHTIVQPDGTERVREQVMVTAKGLTKLATLLALN